MPIALQIPRRYGIIRDIVNSPSFSSPVELNHLTPGESGVIASIQAEESVHQRLQALGFRIGKQITLIRRASFSGPLQVRIATTDVLLRRREAAKITVHKL